MMDFSDALRCIKDGAKAAREGWNVGGQWVGLSPGFTLGPEHVFTPTIREAVEQRGTDAIFRPHLMLSTTDGSFVPWAPTVSDVLAEDWVAL